MNRLPGSEIRPTAEPRAHAARPVTNGPFQISPIAQEISGAQQHMAHVKNAIRLYTAW